MSPPRLRPQGLHLSTLVLAIAVCQLLPWLVQVWLVSISFTFVCISTTVLLCRRNKSLSDPEITASPLFRITFAAFTGIVVGTVTTMFSHKPSAIEPGDHYVIGRVAQEIRHPVSESIWFTIRLRAVRNGANWRLIDEDLLCRAPFLPWRNAALIRANMVVGARVRIGKDIGSTFPRCRIRALSVLSPKVSRSESNWLSLPSGPSVHDAVYRVLGRDEVTELLLAMTLGVRGRVSEAHARVFRHLGISHLLVFSGLQLSLFFFAVRGILRLFRVSDLPSQFLALGAAATLLALSGAEPSGVRAMAALVAFVGADLFGKTLSWRELLGIALLVVLICWPKAIASPGVQLTMAALCSLGLSSEITKGRRGWKYTALSGVLCTLTTAMVGGWWFGSWSPVALILGPFFTSIYTFLSIFLYIPAVTLATVVPQLGQIPLVWSWATLWWSLQILDLFASLGALTVVLPPVFWLIGLIVVALLHLALSATLYTELKSSLLSLTTGSKWYGKGTLKHASRA